MQSKSRNGYSVVDDTKVVFLKKVRPEVGMEELRLLDTFLPELLNEMMQFGKTATTDKETPR